MDGGMIVSLCKHCGSLAGDLSEISRVKRELSKRQQTLFETLLTAGDDGISKIDLSSRLYGERIGATQSAMHLLQGDLRQLRRKVERFGYFIPPLRPYRSNYRILPMEVSR